MSQVGLAYSQGHHVRSPRKNLAHTRAAANAKTPRPTCRSAEPNKNDACAHGEGKKNVHRRTGTPCLALSAVRAVRASTKHASTCARLPPLRYDEHSVKKTRARRREGARRAVQQITASTTASHPPSSRASTRDEKKVSTVAEGARATQTPRRQKKSHTQPETRAKHLEAILFLRVCP